MKNVFSFGVLLMLCFSLQAQFSVGVRGGYGAHGLALSPTSIEKYQVPYYLPNGGLQIIYNNENNAGIVMEVNIAQKGWREQDSTVAGSNFQRTFTYLETPVYSRWELGTGKVRPLIIMGPYLGWKLKETTDSTNFGHIWNPEHPYNHFGMKARDVDFGIKIILGLKYQVTKRFSVFVDARYDVQIAGGRDIFAGHPGEIQASRLKELSGSFGVVWDIIPQKTKEEAKGYKPKENLFEEY